MFAKIKTTVLFIVLLFFSQNLLADATPFKRRLTINLDIQHSKKDAIQKVCILEHFEGKIKDSICGCHGSTCLVLEDKTISISRSVPEDFRLFFLIGGKQRISPVLNKTGSDSLIELKITDNEIIETTPFFRVPFDDYLLAFSLTILFELLFGCAFFIKHKIKLSNLKFILLCNLISHPLLWLSCSYLIGWDLFLIPAEGIVTLFEAVLLYWLIKPKLAFQTSFLLSVILNAASFIFGGILYLILS
ncbi:hypothetical protein [Flavobacterium pedocola]